jgi:phosphoribosylformylglycinamidine synthase
MREEGMTPYEIMLSESQERMLMILKPEKESVARKIFEKWELSYAIIGKITDTGNIVLKMHGEVAADMPIAPVSTDAPVYDRPWVPTPKRVALSAASVPAPKDLGEALLTLLSCPDLSSKRWIYEQYDHMVGNDTVARPGGDAAVVRVHDTKKGLAITTDCTPRYCYADPVEGGKQAVAETWRNLTNVGATPLAITNCLNFGNPEKPETMGQIVGCLQGMAEACRTLDYPIISGNVSLYNETSGKGVFPTPAIGGVGIIKDLSKCIGNAFTVEDQDIWLLGTVGGHLGSSLYLREILNREDGPPPSVDLAMEKKTGDCVRSLINQSIATACHDISDGGLLVALAEMTYRKGIGALVKFSKDMPAHAYAFGEDQGCYILTADAANAKELEKQVIAAGVALSYLGKTKGTTLEVLELMKVETKELRTRNEQWMPEFMA